MQSLAVLPSKRATGVELLVRSSLRIPLVLLQALLLGRLFESRGLFRHVTRDHVLKDAILFYRFSGLCPFSPTTPPPLLPWPYDTPPTPLPL